MKTIKLNDLVKSNLPQHKELTTWRVKEIYKNSRGQNLFFCECSHDTKFKTGFDKVSFEFKQSEIELK